MKKIAILCADGFEEIEGLTVVDLLRRADVVCDIVAVGDASPIVGSHAIRVLPDRLFKETDFSEYDGIVLPGGLRGTAALAADGRVETQLRSFCAQGKLTAAICAAPTVLAQADLLRGKTAVCYPGMEDRLSGAVIGDSDVVEDGTVITSRGAGTAVPFALRLVAYLVSEERAKQLASAIVYDRKP